jgi:hypothetical protein
MDEGDAHRKAEKPEDSRKAAGGTRENTVRERQTSAAAEENAQPETPKLLEEVLRRENLIAALRRVQSNKGAPSTRAVPQNELAAHPGRVAERAIYPRARTPS